MSKKMLIVSLTYGRFSEIWMQRQIKAFRRFSPSVLTWQLDGGVPQADLDITVLDYPVDSDSKSFPVRCFSRLKCLADLNFYASRGAERNEIKEYLQTHRPDVILCHFGWTGLRIIDVASQLGIPVAVHFHGRDISSCLSNKWYRWSLKNRLNHFSRIIVVGSHQYRWMLENGFDQSRLDLIPCGVPTDQFTPPTDPNDQGPVQFINVSRLDREKGLEYSLKAFKLVTEKIPDAKLTIIGDGSQRAELEKRIGTMNLGDNVIVTGAKEPDEVLRYLRSSDIFIQHSIQTENGWVEGFGVTIAEAASVGLPVVVSDCGGIVDQVIDGSTGYIVPQKNVTLMAERMMSLAFDQRLRMAIGRAGRERMVKHFDAKDQTEKLENSLLKLLTGKANCFEKVSV